MAVRRVKSECSHSAEATRLREVLRANIRPVAENDPLKISRERVDSELRELKSRRKTLVTAID